MYIYILIIFGKSLFVFFQKGKFFILKFYSCIPFINALYFLIICAPDDLSFLYTVPVFIIILS